jgi:hypothetical protein
VHQLNNEQNQFMDLSADVNRCDISRELPASESSAGSAATQPGALDMQSSI